MKSALGLPKKVKLKDGRIATISFLSKKDSVRELRGFVNGLVAENTYITDDKKVTLKEEEKWKAGRISAFRKRNAYQLVARIAGKIAGTTGAGRGKGKERGDVGLSLLIAKGYRGIGLGEALLRTNIQVAESFLKPKTIFLGVLAPNKPARALYKKVGFREFAVFPKWTLHKGKYVDEVFMKL
ncbi:GNAT family N-acetyltransferase [Candidatus Micrarchaeota archaeon]|nr:GNAT family N-acetyltransferase [Candidatus Micrarchaeota archaeon]